MTTTQQPEALRLAEALLMGDGMIPELDLPDAAIELRRLYAYAVELEEEVQELRKVKDAGIDRISDLTAQLEAIGAGGVEALRKKGA